MNFLDIFKKNTTVDSTGILSEPGDKLEARVTNSNRKVVKYRKIMGIQSIVQLSTRMVQLWKRKWLKESNSIY